MKHVKTFEKKNFKDYAKYTDIAKIFLKELVNMEYLKIYKEDDEINMSIKTWYGVSSNFFKEIEEYIGKDKYYKIDPNNGSQMTIEFFNIDPKFLEILDIKMSANKYNL
jgi:hypothetical protein